MKQEPVPHLILPTGRAKLPPQLPLIQWEALKCLIT